jgi:ClpP class serine protease
VTGDAHDARDASRVPPPPAHVAPDRPSRAAVWADRAWRAARTLFFLLLIYIGLQQMCAPAQLRAARARALAAFQQARGTRVIALIHRREVVSFLGVQVSSSINIEDSEAVLRAIRLTPADQPIDMILHTPGGLVLAAEQIARALVRHKGRVTVFIPHYAMSGGTLIALTADQIVMDPNAVLGPVDPQIGGAPAASILAVLERKPPAQISDEMLVLVDMAGKAQRQVRAMTAEILGRRMPPEKSDALAATLSEGRWTHDFPITVEAGRSLGLPISVEMPPAIYQLMDLYPQTGAGRPSVLYTPMRRPAAPPTPAQSPAAEPR